MSELVEYNNSLKEGEKKLESNEFFQDLCGLMENEQFKRFLDIYISVHIIDVGNVPNIHQIRSLFEVF